MATLTGHPRGARQVSRIIASMSKECDLPGQKWPTLGLQKVLTGIHSSDRSKPQIVKIGTQVLSPYGVSGCRIY